MRAKWPIALAAGLVALLGAGTGGFLLVRTDRWGPESCASGPGLCVPELKGGDVVGALKVRGHQCADKDGDRWECALTIGESGYEAAISVRGDQVRSVYVSARSAGEGISAGAKAFVTWFAELPFAEDPEVAATVDRWVERRIGGGKEVTDRIAGWKYTLDNSRRENLVTFGFEGSIL